MLDRPASPRPRIAALMRDTYDRELVAAAIPEVDVQWFPDSPDWDEARLAATIRAHDAVITGRDSPALPAAVISDRGQCRALFHCHGTIKHLISKAHLDAGWIVTNWGDQVAGVAEGALSLLLTCLKQVSALDRFIRNDWKNDQRVFQDVPGTLIGAAVGLYGFGPIGRHMARMLSAIGARVHIYDPYATDVPADITVCSSLRALFEACPFISIHCGLNAQTSSSITAELLALMPQGGILINTARGGIIDESALVQALQSGRIIAGLDVIVDERTWATGPLAAIPSTHLLLSGHIIGRGKGPDPAKPAKPRCLPPFICRNARALAHGTPLIHVISAAQYDLKT